MYYGIQTMPEFLPGRIPPEKSPPTPNSGIVISKNSNNIKMESKQLMSITDTDIRDMQQFREDREFLERHKDEFKERYPNEWIAVSHKEIAGKARGLDSLITELKEKGTDPGNAVIYFLSTIEDIMIL